MISLIPIGSNGLYPTEGMPTSCYYIEACGKKIVLDLGSGSFSALKKIVEPESVDLIIISHFHLDHCADLGVFGYYMQQIGKKIPLFCPGDQNAFSLFGLNKNFDATAIKEGVVDFCGVGLEFIGVNHPVETYAVRIFCEGKTLSFTADTNECEALGKVFSKSDLVISDSAFLYKDWSDSKPHISALHCGKYAENYRVRTLLSHIDPRADRAALLSEARSVSGYCELIENGKKYIV